MDMYSKLQKFVASFVVLLIVVFASWALLRPDFFRIHDFTQGARIVEMTNAIRDGHFPVIWSENLGFGYGMPLFEFYAPLPYYVGTLFYLLGFNLINSIKVLILISTVFTAIGGYLLGKKLYGVSAGLLVSAAITLAPYRAVNLFVRGAISEAWGIMALPFILLGILKTIKNEKNGWLVLVISILVLLLSHNLTALVFLPFSVLFGAGYLFLEIKQNKKFKKNILNRIAVLAGCYILAVIMSSFYTIPALLEKDFTRLESTILAEYFDYKLHFVGLKQFVTENWGYGGSTYGPQDGISFYLGFGQLLALFLSTYIVVSKIYTALKNKSKLVLDKRSVLYLFLLFLFATSLLMATNKTMFIWNAFVPLQFLQFPWRYLSAVSIFLGLLSGSLIHLLPNTIFKYTYVCLVLALTLVLNTKYFQPEFFTSNLTEYYYSDQNKIRTDMSKTLPDYIPVQIEAKEINPVALEGQVLYCQVLNTCDMPFKILTDKVQEKSVLLTVAEPKNIIFSVASYPGWTGQLDGTISDISSSEEGFIQVFVPAGEHTVTIALKSTPIRRISNWLSMGGLTIFLGMFFWYYNKND